MNSIVRPIITLLLVLISAAMLMAYGKSTMHASVEDELNYALRVATQDATRSMIDDNHLFGRDAASQEFNVDLGIARQQFLTSFRCNSLPSQITDVDVSFYGIADLWYIRGEYANGSKTLPYSYVFYKEIDSMNVGDKVGVSQMYEFSLGDSFRVTNLNTGATSGGSLRDLPEYYFSSKVKNASFRDIAVMNAINDFLTKLYSSTENITVMNAASGITFNLGLFDYADDDSSVITTLPAMVDGPGYFSVVDYYDVFLDQRVRVLALSSAELVRNN